MEDFKTIDVVVQESIRNSSYYSVLISSCVFIVYTLIIKIVDYFKSKDKNKPIIEMGNAIKENTANIVKLNAVLDKVFHDYEKKEAARCRTAIELAFSSFANNVNNYCQNVIIHNNIKKNKDLIIDNIGKIVRTEYYKTYSALSSYDIHGTNVATRLKTDWIQEVATNMTEIIYNGQDAINRLSQINNRLSIDIGNYITYITNKTFNT